VSIAQRSAEMPPGLESVIGREQMTNKSWIIFDADNTLWDVESLYDDARTEFCRYALELLNREAQNPDGSLTLDLLERSQRHRDIQLKKTHGYSSSRFARSFEDTLLFFFQYAPPDAVMHVRGIAQSVFDKPGRLVDDLEQIIIQLGTKFSLAIITAGERWVQDKRIAEFHLRDCFEHIIVVEKKTALDFKKFCVDRNVKAEDCWVVGDSIGSDIAPAKEAGLNAIHVRAPNWAAEHGVAPAGTPSVGQLKEILKILL
jgi:putative hydrolase of the HAD superfamily